MNNFSDIWLVNSHAKGHCGYNALQTKYKQTKKVKKKELLQLNNAPMGLYMTMTWHGSLHCLNDP